jgi:hypothetical protein
MYWFCKSESKNRVCCCVSGHEIPWNPEIKNLQHYLNGWERPNDVTRSPVHDMLLEGPCAQCNAIFSKQVAIERPAYFLVWELMEEIGRLKAKDKKKK